MFFTADSMHPAALGRALEERGFESLWVPEHTHIPSALGSAYPASGGLQRAYYEIMDPFLALNTAATATTRLKVGTGIALVIQRDPILTAKEVSTIDQLSAGRFLFGVGNGWNQVEIENHGTAFRTRHKLARERIEAMKAIWAGEEPEYHGEFVNFDKMKQWPKPWQKPHPPIIVGGGFPHAARRAVRTRRGGGAGEVQGDGAGGRTRPGRAAHQPVPGTRKHRQVKALRVPRDRSGRVLAAGGEGAGNPPHSRSLERSEAAAGGLNRLEAQLVAKRIASFLLGSRWLGC
jgi:probable F420-dependent oxidoreductase